MKNVAGFHSFDLAFLLIIAPGELLRSGFGTRLAQKDGCMMLGAVPYCRGAARRDCCKTNDGNRVVRTPDGARRTWRSIAGLGIMV